MSQNGSFTSRKQFKDHSRLVEKNSHRKEYFAKYVHYITYLLYFHLCH